MSKGDMILLTLFGLLQLQGALGFFPYPNTPRLERSTQCAVCTVLVGLAEQLVHVRKSPPAKVLRELCTMFPAPLGELCHKANHYLGADIANLIKKNNSADGACVKLGFCHREAGKPLCHLFPLRQGRMTGSKDNEVVGLQRWNATGICDLPGIKQICKYVQKAFFQHLPSWDVDGDRFSTRQTLRGSTWRGKDCSDVDKNVHPGRKPSKNDRIFDTNCNGIFGFDVSNGVSYEEELCGDSQARGYISLGDSVTANFHAPGEFFNVSAYYPSLFANLTYIIANEGDWPETSMFTGYVNLTWPVIHGTTQSIYSKLRERNLCNHRDFQNIGVNGAKTSTGIKNIDTISRDQQKDRPVLFSYAFVGNDVCNGELDTLAAMTTPKEIQENLLAALAKLDGILPAGSDVVVVGLIDARYLFDSLHDRIHPIGWTRQDVTYQNLYEWFDCLDVTPCRGWLSSNATLRNETARVQRSLNAALEETVVQYGSKYKNFNVTYVAIPESEVIQAWIQDGGEVWQLIEAADGFHPNQIAHRLIADAFWKEMEKANPNLLGPENPKNDKIRKLFGSQGGY